MDEIDFDFMKLWTLNDEESESKMKPVLLDGLDSVVQRGSDVLSKIECSRPIDSPIVRWMEEWGYPSTISAQLTANSVVFSSSLFGKPIDGISVRKVIREGTILERRRDGCQAKISSVQGLTAAVESYGATALNDDLEPVSWDVISEAWSDFRGASESRSLDRFFREVGTQIFAETFEIPKTRKNTKYEVVSYETEHQIIALLQKLRRQLAYAVLRSRPFHDGSQFVWGDKTEEPTMCGLCAWPIITQNESPNPKVFVNKAGEALTKHDLDDLTRDIWLDEHADYGAGDWRIVCHPSVHQFIHDFDISYRRIDKKDKEIGFRVDEFHSKIGKTFPILSEPYMRPGVLILVNFEAFKYGYYANDSLQRKEISTQGRYQRWLLTFQTYGVVARNPRANIGMIYGLA
jgi:hypothetical protein